MKVKLKTVSIVVAGVALLDIIGGETFYIINSKKNLKQISDESAQLKSNLSEKSLSLEKKKSR